nr:shikimate dehydrogenase [uncultured Lachnoanaerobaculum sp.]
MISASTSVYGIVGNPIEHSLSPLLQNALAKEMNIDMSYVAFHVTDNIKVAIDGAYLLGIKGLNVTIPFKKDMINIVTDIDERAKKIGAINTLKRVKSGYKGYNTDILGLNHSIKSNGMSIHGKNVIILGAGGAAKAALYLVVEEDAKSITIINRNVKRANELKKEVCDTFKNISVVSLDELKQNLDVLEYNDYFVFQTTNVGMYPKIDECIIDDAGFYEKCDCGIDLIYTPFETVFIKNMLKANKKCINGLDMLILQGVASFEIWNDIKVEQPVVENVKVLLTEKLKERMK